MARRRRPSRRGDGNQALMAMYGDITARERAQQQARLQHDLNVQLAVLQKKLQAENAKMTEGINTEQQILGRVLSNPRDAERLLGNRSMLAGVETGSLLPSAENLLDPFMEQTREAKTRFEVPGEQDIFSSLGRTREEVAEPTIEQMVSNIGGPRIDPQTPMLNAATNAMDARESRLDDIGSAEGMDILTKGLGAKETALGQARGQAAGEAEAFGAKLARDLNQQNVLGAAKNTQELAQFKAMTPLEVERARQVAAFKQQGTRRMFSSDANRIAELDTSLDDLAALRQEIGNTGAQSKLGVMLPNVVTEFTGWGADAKSRQGTIDRVKQVIGKALEGGVLRKEDEYKYEKILPTIGDPPPVALAKLDGLEKALVQRRLTLLEALDDAGFDTSQFPTTATNDSQTGGPRVGEIRDINGTLGEWDGSQWVEVTP